jgi:hypothetical protein
MPTLKRSLKRRASGFNLALGTARIDNTLQDPGGLADSKRLILTTMSSLVTCGFLLGLHKKTPLNFTLTAWGNNHRHSLRHERSQSFDHSRPATTPLLVANALASQPVASPFEPYLSAARSCWAFFALAEMLAGRS